MEYSLNKSVNKSDTSKHLKKNWLQNNESRKVHYSLLYYLHWKRI